MKNFQVEKFLGFANENFFGDEKYFLGFSDENVLGFTDVNILGLEKFLGFTN